MKENTRVAAALILAFVTVAGASAQNSTQSPTPAPNAAERSVLASDLPPEIASNSALEPVVRRLESGVVENSILADITQSGGPFHLNAADIAFLNDLGTPGEIESAMIQRDKELGVTDVTEAQQTPPPAPDQGAQPQDVTEDYFYGALSSYGRWTNISGYGFCWQPYAAINNPAWSPYCTQGQWIYTDYGWYWLSGYSWGWCTFHYGRWFHDANQGWCWWPATKWAPSWVFWRYAGNYCGWAPLPPGCYYSQENGLVYNGAAIPQSYDFGIGAGLFDFIPMANLGDDNMEHFRLQSAIAAQVFAHSKALIAINSNNRIIVNDGIPVRDILLATGKVMRSVRIQPVESVAAPGTRGEQILPDGETLVIDRPYFKTDVASALRQGIWPVPSQVQPVAHQPPSFIVNENPASYQPANNQDNSVIYVDSAAQDAPPVPTVTTAGPQDYAGPAPSFAAGPDQSYWSVAAQAPAPIEDASVYMSPRRESHDRWQHRVPQEADHHEFNPPAGGSPPEGHPTANHSDGHVSHPEQGHGDEHSSAGAPSQSHSAPTDGSHGDKK